MNRKIFYKSTSVTEENCSLKDWADFDDSWICVFYNLEQLTLTLDTSLLCYLFWKPRYLIVSGLKTFILTASMASSSLRYQQGACQSGASACVTSFFEVALHALKHQQEKEVKEAIFSQVKLCIIRDSKESCEFLLLNYSTQYTTQSVWDYSRLTFFHTDQNRHENIYLILNIFFPDEKNMF